ncbi:hypothetical protein SCHPADRAFT_936131 [Schizopora paradoxa]|uniref:Uncharacterized protein n=1 Tax=Schizopora paradoxa TaxID=27342 RepID=A0A0H2SMZ4_9AGAM|nr:hypothetical protein SCHPADRAFT_936131 [Schizopora paradoxa]
MPAYRTSSSLPPSSSPSSRSTTSTHRSSSARAGGSRSCSSSPPRKIPVPQHYRTTAVKFAHLKSRLRVVDQLVGTIPSYNIHNGDIEPLAYPKWSRASGPVEPVSNLLRDFYHHNEDQWPTCFHGLKVRIIDVKSGINAGTCCAVCGCNPGDEDCNFWVIFNAKVPTDPSHFETDAGDSTSQFRSVPSAQVSVTQPGALHTNDLESILSDAAAWSGSDYNGTSPSQPSSGSGSTSSLDEVEALIDNTERVVCDMAPLFEGGPPFFITEKIPPPVPSTTHEVTLPLPLPSEGTSGYDTAFRAWTPPPATLGSMLPTVHHHPTIRPTTHFSEWRAATVDLATTRGVHLDTFWKLWGVCDRCNHVVSSAAWESHYNNTNCVAIIQGTVPGVSSYYM